MGSPHTLFPPSASTVPKGPDPSSSCSSHASEQQQQQHMNNANAHTTANADDAHGSSGDSCHVVEVAGPLPPWSLTRVCAALQVRFLIVCGGGGAHVQWVGGGERH